MKLFYKITRVSKGKYSKALLFLPLLLTVQLCCGCGQESRMVQRVDTAMGTIVSQSLYVSDASRKSQEIGEEVLFCIQRLEEDYLSWRLETSELYGINKTAGSGQGVETSAFLSSVLERCRLFYRASGGAFDDTIGGIARLWNIDKWAVDVSGFEVPAEEQLREALQSVGGDKCVLEGNVIQLPEGLQLDLGAVGKGVALDEIRALLEQQKEVTGAVISVGGSVLTYGDKPDGQRWRVGIVNPMDTSENIGVLQLPGGWCVSTSGDYERYVEKENTRYHHILNPLTGMPADSGVHSVTIASGRGLDSDALSTACFVLGVEKGMKLAEEFEAEALFVLTDGEIVMTEGMKEYFIANL